MSGSVPTVQGQVEYDALEPGEVLVKTFLPTASTYWLAQGALVLIAARAVTMTLNAGSGTSRMIWSVVGSAAAYHAIRDVFQKPRLMSVQWKLTNRRLIGPRQAWQLKDIKWVSYFLHDVTIVSAHGERATLQYLPSASAAVLAIKAAKEALQ